MKERVHTLKAVKNILERDIKFSVPFELVKKIDNAIKDENIDLTILAKEIEFHPLLTLKILKVANSPLYGFPQRISSVYHALILLGLQAVRYILLGAFVSDMLQREKDLYFHSFKTSLACRWFIEKFSLRTRETEEVITAGIIHDLGKLFFEILFKEKYKKIKSIWLENKIRCKDILINLEREQFGIDHAELGAIVMKEWYFPDNLVQIVFHHHDLVHYFNKPQKEKGGLLFLSDLFANISSLKEYGCLETIKEDPNFKLAFQYIQTLFPDFDKDKKTTDLESKDLQYLIFEFDEYCKTQKTFFEVII